MKVNKAYIVVGMIIAFALFFEIAAHADVLDQAAKISFGEPIQIPGHILPAGTYWFTVVDSNSDQNLVQVFNADRAGELAEDAAGRDAGRLIDCLELCEDTRRRLERNVLEDLALEALFNRLRRSC